MSLENQIISAVRKFANSIHSGHKVVADISLLIEATSQLPLSNFDYWERLIRYEFSKALEHSLQEKGKIETKAFHLLTCLDLISWDGYKREKALRTISGAAPNAFFFSLAMRRLNDWVPAVRNAAREKLPTLAQETSASDVAQALCAVFSCWNSWGRIEEEGRQRVLDIASIGKIAEELKRQIILSPSGPMAFIFTQLGRRPILDKYLREITENAVQPSLRAKAYRSQYEGRMVWLVGRQWEWTDIRYCEDKIKAVIDERKLILDYPFLELLRKSAVDRSSIVRRVSAEFLIREMATLGDEALQLAKHFAKDKSRSVAERGKFALKKLRENK